MATISVDVSELPRLADLANWAKPGDRFVVVPSGDAAGLPLPADPWAKVTAMIPPPPPVAGPRPLGTHRGATVLPDDFNDPTGLDGLPLPKGQP